MTDEYRKILIERVESSYRSLIKAYQTEVEELRKDINKLASERDYWKGKAMEWHPEEKEYRY